MRLTWKLSPSASSCVSRRTPAFLSLASPLRTPRLWSAQSTTSFMSFLSWFTSATAWSWSESQPWGEKLFQVFKNPCCEGVREEDGFKLSGSFSFLLIGWRLCKTFSIENCLQSSAAIRSRLERNVESWEGTISRLCVKLRAERGIISLIFLTFLPRKPLIRLFAWLAFMTEKLSSITALSQCAEYNILVLYSLQLYTLQCSID